MNRFYVKNFILVLCFITIEIQVSIGQSSFSAGSYHSLYLCTNGIANSWGNNVNGALGDGTTGVDRLYPVPVSSLTGVVQVSAGDFHTLFVRSNGTVWACGNNANGELGDGTTTSHSVPTQVPSLSGIIAAAAGEGFSLFLKNDSTVWSCGRNSFGQLGDNSTVDKLVPVQVRTMTGLLTGVKQIAVGRNHSLFLKGNGQVFSCGSNFRGQLGIGNNQDRLYAVLATITSVKKISAGWEHSLFLKADSTVWACGYNLYGQLGDASNMNRSSSVQVGGPSLTGAISIEAGGDHTLICKGTGTVWSCGKNTYGQLGDGTQVDKNTVVQVTGLSAMTDVAAGAYHSLFLKNDGSLWSAGGNFSGQLGDSTTTMRLTPVKVKNLCAPTGIDDSNAEIRNSIALLNQPTADVLCASIHLGENSNLVVAVYDIQGRIQKRQTLRGLQGNNLLNIDFLQYSPGIYIIRVYNESMSLEKKFVKI
jgi:alpha-tubulin suppressor-like RCC1 family protein